MFNKLVDAYLLHRVRLLSNEAQNYDVEQVRLEAAMKRVYVDINAK